MLLLRKSHGQRSLSGYSPWGSKESDMTELVNNNSLVSTAEGKGAGKSYVTGIYCSTSVLD